jgi:hypothetical protein
MKTDDLIAALATDNRTLAQRPPLRVLALAVAAAVLVAGLLLVLTIGVRPDVAGALQTWRFDLKFVVTISLGAAAFLLVAKCLYPESSERPAAGPLLVPLTVLLVGAGIELASIAPEAWAMSATGENGLLCITIIPALGIIPLGLIVAALRSGAPVRPGLAGLGAGLLAGAISATFYAANCTDDSPLFVLTWYPIAIAILGVLGAALGRAFARW